MPSNSRRIRRPNKYSSDLTSQKSKSSAYHDSSESTAAFSLDSLKIKRTQQQLQLQQQQQQQHNQSHSGQPRRSYCARSLFCLFVASTIVLVVRQMSLFLPSHATSATGTVASTKKTSSSSNIRNNNNNNNKNNKNQMVPKPGEYAPISAAADAASTPLTSLLQPPTSEYHIFVLGTEGDQTTIRLINILLGLFDHSDAFLAITKWSVVGDGGGEYLTRYQNRWVDTNVTITSLVVGDETDVTQLAREFRSQYQHLFYFVVVTPATQDVCQAPIPQAMVCVDASMVANIHFGVGGGGSGGKDKHSKDGGGITATVATMIQTIQTQLPYFAKVKFNVVETLRRMNAMEEMMMQMADMPATSHETKYGVTGGSRKTKKGK